VKTTTVRGDVCQTLDEELKSNINATVVNNNHIGDDTAEIERCDADSDEINRKILQVIEYTFSSNIRKKVRKSLLLS
jgi:hypothetical protein